MRHTTAIALLLAATSSRVFAQTPPADETEPPAESPAEPPSEPSGDPPPEPPTDTSSDATPDTSTDSSSPQPETQPSDSSSSSSDTSSSSEDKTPDPYDFPGGLGMFHAMTVWGGAISGKSPDMGLLPSRGATHDAMLYALYLEFGKVLGQTTAGHNYGLYGRAGYRSHPFEIEAETGPQFSLVELGEGGAGTLHVTGAFGIGDRINKEHGLDFLAFLRGSAAIILVPRSMDLEVSALWIPSSANSNDYDEQTYRASVWIRRGSGKFAVGAYVEYMRRRVDDLDDAREIEGVGGGITLGVL